MVATSSAPAAAAALLPAGRRPAARPAGIEPPFAGELYDALTAAGIRHHRGFPWNLWLGGFSLEPLNAADPPRMCLTWHPAILAARSAGRGAGLGRCRAAASGAGFRAVLMHAADGIRLTVWPAAPAGNGHR